MADKTRRTQGPRHPFRLVKETAENDSFVIKVECLVCGNSCKCDGGSGKNSTLQNFVHHHVERPSHQKSRKFGTDENNPTATKAKKPAPRKRKELAASSEPSAEVSAGGAGQISSSTAPSQPMTVANARTPQGYKDALLNLQQSDASPSSRFHSMTWRVIKGEGNRGMRWTGSCVGGCCRSTASSAA